MEKIGRIALNFPYHRINFVIYAEPEIKTQQRKRWYGVQCIEIPAIKCCLNDEYLFFYKLNLVIKEYFIQNGKQSFPQFPKEANLFNIFK